MRKWYKYALDPSTNGNFYQPIDHNFQEHEKAMGGYVADENYRTKQAFFKKYFNDFHKGRLIHYDKFLRKYLKREQDILSIASGRCANELYLAEDGYRITCSDLKKIDAFQETSKLFPSFKFIELDILNEPSLKKYDALICLSLIYLFDDKDLAIFFRHVSESLRTGGNLLLDSAGSADNLQSYLIHDILLKYEMMLRRVVKFLMTKRWQAFVTKHHGYRRSDDEIIACAGQHGFKVVAQENYAFTIEFGRSCILNRIISSSSIMEKTFSILGRNIPYVRMYSFEKVS